MSGIIILPESKDELNIRAVTLCEKCVSYVPEFSYCRQWKKETSEDGWCYKGEEPDDNDLYEEEE